MQIEDRNQIVLSVSEYLERLNIALGAEAGFVQGEVIEFKAGAKWVGFTLKDKDDGSVLKCVSNTWNFKRMGVQIEDGMEVKVYGTPRVSKGWGSLGLWIESIEPLGEGSLKKAYELLLKKLEAEGLFARKRALPEFVTRIGVVSSREGVVIQDLRKNLRRLSLRVDFVHSQVEGAAAVSGILRALSYFSRHAEEYDVVVVIRGGGSLESMQAFNNEEVVRAIFGMPMPVVAGLGHDVDVPLAALVADREASTPTAVAHVINETWNTLVEGLPRLERDIQNLLGTMVYHCIQRVDLLEQRMLGYFTKLFRSFDQTVARMARALDRVGERISALGDYLDRTERLLKLSDPLRNLRLGYSLTLSGGRVVKSKRDVKIGDTLETRVSDGVIKSNVS
jgi:exodeoxyribonuclease VII large subunit